MGCVLLPSKTAKLVYGYLMKENMNEIASQFLESSPYLTDCCQIVKSGYQFNTKFMSKDLHELLQEYSSLLNIVNNKVSMLPKTSLLYKKIKLNCESLPEIVELILFWKYKLRNSSQSLERSGVSSPITKNNSSMCSTSTPKDNNKHSSAPTIDMKGQSSFENIKQINQLSRSEEVSLSENRNSVNSSDKQSDRCSSVRNENLSDSYAESRTQSIEFHESSSGGKQYFAPQNVSNADPKTTLERPSTRSNVSGYEHCHESDTQLALSKDVNYTTTHQERTKFLITSSNNGKNDTRSPAQSGDNIGYYYSDGSAVNLQERNHEASKDSNTNLASHPEKGKDKIEIVHMEPSNQNISQPLSLILNSQRDSNSINLEEGNVVFVDQPVDDLRLSEDQNQIIVIPIDYYKSDGMVFQNDLTNNDNVKEVRVINCHDYAAQSTNPDTEYNQSELGVCDMGEPSPLEDENADIVKKILKTSNHDGIRKSRHGGTTKTNLHSNNKNENSNVDSVIMTEETYLQNKSNMYNLTEKAPVNTFEMIPKISAPVAVPVAVPVPVIAAPSPTLLFVPPLPPQPVNKFRNILPKKEPPKIEINPVVVVHPLLKGNKDLNELQSCAGKPEVDHKKIRPKRTPLTHKPVNNAHNGANQNTGKKMIVDISDSPDRNMPAINFPLTPLLKENSKPEDEQPPVNDGSIAAAEPGKNLVSEPAISEVPVVSEKNSLEKNEGQDNAETKNETPVVSNPLRNRKRLSLSTPRRKSHVRALEFETPPKTNEEKKKSQTSPKAKVDPMPVERKNVRNTLFKSPDSETIFKSPSCLKNASKSLLQPCDEETLENIEPLNELSIPIATRTCQDKLSEVWGNLTGVSCVLGEAEPKKTARSSKKSWDTDLRGFIGTNEEVKLVEKKRIRKTKKVQKNNKKSCTKNEEAPPKRIKTNSVAVSPKISLTAKRNTYSISENGERSPIRSLHDDLKLETPFKEPIVPTEETPITKLLRENVSGLDIDLSMINTPSFPPTPSIVITPDLRELKDVSGISGTEYYTPLKDEARCKTVKITDYFKVDTTKTKKQETKETQEKVLGELVTEAKKIIGLCGASPDEATIKRPPTGKLLSMVKIQMITQCDKKLCENIPIREEEIFAEESTTQSVLIESVVADSSKSDLKIELEDKKRRTLKKLKVVKENLTTANRKSIGKRPTRKRRRSIQDTGRDDKRLKPNISDKQNSSSADTSKEEQPHIMHSTPYTDRKRTKFETSESDPSKSFDNTSKSEQDKVKESREKPKINRGYLDEIRQEIPSFDDCSDPPDHLELMEKSRKKIHYVKQFLKLEEVVRYLEGYNETSTPKLVLKPCFRKFFQVFYKWLKHPHRHELNASENTKKVLIEYLQTFDKINKGLKCKNAKTEKTGNTRKSCGEGLVKNNEEEKGKVLDEETENKATAKWQSSSLRKSEKCLASGLKGEAPNKWKGKDCQYKKDDDVEDGVECDGVISTLPLKKRKATVTALEGKDSKVNNQKGKDETVAASINSENASQTQHMLQYIDVDRFLSQIHGQENR